MKKGKGKILSISILLTIILQILIPIIPELNIKVFAAEDAEEIPRNYEIKKEESWDVSKNGDGSVIAKWTLKDRTLTISGTGKMKDWESSSKGDWHNTQYTYFIEKVIIETGVIDLGNYAFQRCSSLTNIEIPEGVTNIGWYVFSGCSSLTNIVIPEGVTSIGESAFEGCSSLRSINVSVNNKNYMSENGILFDKEKKEIICYPSAKDDINKYIIPEGVTSIGSSAFYGCSRLTNIEIPKGVTYIRNYTFKGCSTLTDIIIPEGVTSIGISAFEECSSLTNIEIPEGVTSIGWYAFSGCSSLTDIIIPEGVTSIEISAFEECSSLTDVEIPEGVTSIEISAFEECSSLTNIEIPKGVTSIERSAFSGCSSLTNIEIPEGVTSIESHVFYRCSGLTNIEIPEGVTSIGWNAFSGCSSLTNIVIPEGVTSIGWSAFSGCSSLTDIKIPEGVTSIERNTFEGCSSLTNIVIPEGVTSIGYSAFEGCSSLTDIKIPEGVTSIEGRAFYGCSSLTDIKIPETVTNVGNFFKGVVYVKADSRAHQYMEERREGYILEGEAKNISTEYEIKKEESWDISKSKDGSVIARWTLNDRTLTISGTGEMKDWVSDSQEDWNNSKYKYIIENIIIEEGIVNIGEFAFNNCSILKGIKIGEGVKSIGDNAFAECWRLTNVEISQGVTSIGNSAFYRCSSLTNIVIPKGVTSIGRSVFEGCSSLTNIEIPEGVTSIGWYAFSGCSSLTDVEIPKGVTSIGKSAFLGCSSLKSINVDDANKYYISENGILFNKEKRELTCYPSGKNDIKKYIIPKGVTSIGDGAFLGCSSLTDIIIPEGVTSIGYSAFSGCSSLTNIEIPEGVTSIGDSAFYGCSNLTNLVIPKGVTSIGERAFLGCSSLTDIIIPEGVTSIGDSAFYGCSNLTNLVIPKGVTSIGESAFYGCSSLTDVEIPKGVTGIGESAFEGCSGLTNIEIPEGVTSIGRYAFKECSGLTNIEIPKGVTSIGSYAFEGCSSFTDIVILEGVTSIGKSAFSRYSNLIMYINLNSTAHKYLEENQYKYIIDDEGPIIKYTPNGSLNQQKEYNVKIEVEDNIKEVGINNNSLKFQWTQSIDQPTEESFIESFENGQTINKNTGDGIWYLWVYAEDKLGNVTISRSEGFNFDNTQPNVNVKYSTKNSTKENVKVTITSNEQVREIEGWTLSEDKRILTKEYTQNTDEEITIKDIAGNETQASIGIANIDRKAPDISVEYSIKNSTKENVTVTITSNEEIQEVEGWTLSENKRVLTKEYSQNTEEEIAIKDLAGNETQASIGIANIDKLVPDISVEYSTKNPTKEKVTVTITSNEEIQEVEGWTLSEDKRVLTKEYAQNVEEEITIRDLAGNEIQVSIKIDNIIDETPPIVEVKYSTKNPTKENVTVTIRANEEIQEVEGWTLLEDKRVLKKEYAQNTEEKITIIDLAGNERQVSIEITNIDKEGPDINVEYSTKEPTKENVIVTIRANEEIQEVEGWTLSEDKTVLKKEYAQNTEEEITIRDLAGNEKQVSIEITNIDKKGPDINVEYSTKEPTKENVTVTIRANEEIQEVEGWTLSEDKRVLKKEYAQNTEEEITIRDLAGNEMSVNIEISNIKKTPEVTIEDINQDGKIDITDLLMIKRHLVAGNKNNWILNGNSALAADINQDGEIDITDLLMLKRKLINNI